MSSKIVQGYAVWTTIDGKTDEEADTFTCCHCNRVVFVKVRASTEEMGGFCRLCMKMCCPLCVDKECVPFEKKMERAEARARLLKAVGI